MIIITSLLCELCTFQNVWKKGFDKNNEEEQSYNVKNNPK